MDGIRKDIEAIGFIGLGVMGRPMARNLLKAGYPLVVYDHHPEHIQELVGAGAQGASSAAEVGSRASVIITMLPNSPQVREALLGPDGVAQKALPGAVVVDMSSIAPAAARQIAAELESKGIHYLDAPVSGGDTGAAAGTLSIMVGGDRALLERLRPVLEHLGRSIVWLGPVGSGSMAKLANQIIVAVNIAAVAEAFTLAAKAGLPADVLFQAIRGGLAGSAVLEAKIPQILEGRFQPGFKVDLHSKDLANVLETGRELQVPLPLTALVMQILQALRSAGAGSLDNVAIVRFYEELAHVQVGAASAEKGA
ncbi:MAG: 2-hydroxy-3-oxopropionate reductase [Firmicutes bacterium]|nr:2-hydroxy-3-oxopropionate reductase [Bacillota bacterium]